MSFAAKIVHTENVYRVLAIIAATSILENYRINNIRAVRMAVLLNAAAVFCGARGGADTVTGFPTDIEIAIQTAVIIGR